jgi:hypothetical protein
MVVRYQTDGSVAFALDEVDLMATTATYLYSRAFGSFETTGLRGSIRQGTARLLIPTPQVVNWSTSSDIWVQGSRIEVKRAVNPADLALHRKLIEQLKRSPVPAGV